MADEKEMLLADIKNQVASELQTRGYQSKQEVDAAVEEKIKTIKDLPIEALRAYNQDKEDMQKLINEQKKALEIQGLELRGIKEAQQNNIPDRKTIASQIRAAIEKDKAGWERFKNRETNSFGSKNGDATIAVETRAAATMTIGGSTGGSVFVPSVQVMPGLVDLARNKPFLENYANTTTTGSARIVWTEKFNPQGSAAFIGEGGLKPLISFEIRTIESYAKKVADKIKVSTEMLDDVDFIAGEIENELRYQVDIKVDASLLAGAGDGSVSATDLKGLSAYTSAYSLTTVKTKLPNQYDTIRAAAAQIVSLNFSPSIFFINPIDSANMDLAKDTTGRPLAMEYKDANGRIYRMTPVETNQIPQGKILMGDMSRFKIRNYQPFSVAYGWVNDDFEKNLVTIIGERRLHAFVAANEVGAFVFDTFANILTAITAA